MLSNKFELIEKEAVEHLKFPATEVLTDSNKIEERKTALNRALTLGNLEHSKIKIYFEDDNSFKYIETTVWGITDKRIILKQGMVIPINRVHTVKI